MTFARVLGAIGRTMIASGTLLLLFVVYQLWGTGIHTRLAQQDLEREFEALVAEQASATSTTTSTTAPSDTSTTSTAPPPSYEVAPAAAVLPPVVKGDPIGRIVIPGIGVDFMVIEGVDLYLLDEAPGHFPGTPMPGQPGNAAIAGHRTTFAAPFNRIDELRPGDTIDVTTVQGTFQYEVLPQPDTDPAAPPKGHYIVGPRQTEILDDKADNRLTLMACHPKYSAAQRIVVEAVLTSPPAPAPPRDPDAPAPAAELPGGGTEALLLDNDDTARGPAMAFSAACGLVWLATWLVGRRWRAWRSWRWWLTYLVGAVPFFALLYGAFENINNLLPAGY